jgi:transposase-like protein
MPSKRPEGKVDALALAVARGSSLSAGARAIGISESTARRWAVDPSFKARISEIRSATVSRSIGHLVRASVQAAKTLTDLLKSKDEQVKLSAARTLLTSLISVQSHAELSERIEVLEATIREQQATNEASAA